MSIDLRYSTSFKRALKRIAKKYRQVKLDIQPVINDIMSGKLPGEQIPHVGYPVYKVRIRNRDSQQGQRGGYRMIYYLIKDNQRVLVALYSKAEQSDIRPEDIKRIIDAYDE